MEYTEIFVAPMRPYIQTITENLPNPLANIANDLLGEECYEQLLLNVDFTQPECVKLAVSKGLGIGIVAMSSIVKLPQIFSLLASQSADGLSFASIYLEIVAQLISLAYNFRNGFPFSTFGETALIVIQNVVIAALILTYKNKKAQAALLFVNIAFCVHALFNPSAGLITNDVLNMMQTATIPIGLASKLPQIYSNFANKSTGKLSSFSVVNYLAGSLARVFTTMQEVNDPKILASFVAGAVLNLVLMLQVIFYWNNKPQKVSQLKKRQ
ncbi:Mannose-P-dolichol utilization defect 1 protein [Yarrowia sp. C11]|nr:Mannose-P-dolichol utilization defect 1 protein [Yarrowia sp. E02]KAG5371602.1 Mannose-P-dolichol utilization defect 1 protein [Yarrowia sp. C11]